MENLYKKTTQYQFNDCQLGCIEFKVIEREGELVHIHFECGAMRHQGNIKDVESIDDFTDWIARCIKSTVKEYENKDNMKTTITTEIPISDCSDETIEFKPGPDALTNALLDD